jgi:hypothetical protein
MVTLGYKVISHRKLAFSLHVEVCGDRQISLAAAKISQGL